MDIKIDQYKKLKYQDYEWDNVANIIPKFLIYHEHCLDKQFEQNKEWLACETTEDLRRYAEDRFDQNETTV